MIAHAVQPEAQRDTDALEEEFFSTPPPADVLEIDGWSPAPMSASNRLAMKATLAMLACCALASVAFTAFSEHVFVFPAPLSAAHAQLPPAPLAHQPPAPPALARAIAAPAPSASTPEPKPAAAPAPSSVSALAPAPAHATALISAPAPSPISRSARRAPPARALSSASPAEALVKRALRELAAGQAREAQQLASQAILLDPKYARSYIVLGGARDALGDTAGVRAAFRACVQHAEGPLLSTCKTLAR